MKILWITNVELNCVAEHFGRQVVVGGWMNLMAEQIAMLHNIELSVVSCVSSSLYSNVSVKGMKFFSFNAKNEREILKNVINEVGPDIIHIWGTEYSHTLTTILIAEEKGLLDRVVISIQGLVSVYAQHYCDGLPSKIIKHRTLKEVLSRPNISDSYEHMKRQGESELLAIKKAKHCIGRTDWDKACVRQINPNINYHFCNETLRSQFYNNEWKYDDCDKNSIFFSQSHYPIKGLHYLLKALPIVKRKYPDVKVKVIGNGFGENNGLKGKLRISSYQKYLLELIKENDLRESIEWVGYLNADEMIEQYCKANVFVCSSNIENSSNSIGEAMLLGVPVIASDVGGIKSLLEHNKEGIIYHQAAHYMLADAIMRIFDCKQYAIDLGKKARIRAKRTHNQKENLVRLISVYESIIEADNM